VENYHWIKPNVKAVFKAPVTSTHPIEKLICNELEGKVFTIAEHPRACSRVLSGFMVEVVERDVILYAARKVASMFGGTLENSSCAIDCACLQPLEDDKKDEDVTETKTIPWDELCKEFGIDPARVNDEATA